MFPTRIEPIDRPNRFTPVGGAGDLVPFGVPSFVQSHERQLSAIDAGPQLLKTSELAVMALSRYKVMQQFVMQQVLQDIVWDCFGCRLKEFVDDDHRFPRRCAPELDVPVSQRVPQGAAAELDR